MAGITVEQVLNVVRQLSPEEQGVLIEKLLDERFTAAMAEGHRLQAERPPLTDEEIQAEVDAVRRQQHQERLRASGD